MSGADEHREMVERGQDTPWDPPKCKTCAADDPAYEGWVPFCCWDDSSGAKPCPECNPNNVRGLVLPT